jgi:soluble lytic murein transglycosylase-like protein
MKRYRGATMCRAILVTALLLGLTYGTSLAQSNQERLRQALLLKQAGQWQQALQAIGTLESPQDASPSLARLLFLRATLAIQLHDPEAAMRDFARVLQTYPPLADYAGWEMMQYFAVQDRLIPLQETITVLATRYPFSLMLPDSRLLLAKTQIRLGLADQAQTTLEHFLQTHETHRLTPEVLFLLGQLYADNGKLAVAAQTLQRLGESYPTHALAASALQRSANLWAQVPAEQRPPPDPEHLLASLNGLIQAQHWPEVEARLAILERFDSPPALVARVLLKRATVALRRRSLPQASTVLHTLLRLQPQGEHTAEALYLLGQVYQRQDDQANSEQQYEQLLTQYARSPWAAEALWVLAQMLENRQRLERASELYQRLGQDFPSHDKAEDSLWQAGWLQYGLGHYDSAIQIWRRFEAQSPHAEMVPQVLYWQARAAHSMGQQPTAEGLYRRIIEEYPFHYYSLHAAQRLQYTPQPAQGPAVQPSLTAVWTQNPPVRLPDASLAQPSQPQFHLLRVQELQQLQMLREAVREIRMLVTLLPDTQATRYFLGTLFVDNQYYPAAFRSFNTLLRGLRPDEVRGLPRDFWTMLYPKVFWDEVTRLAQRTGLDPYLVVSIMRQESAFDPAAVSASGARGLMQLMPATAREVSGRLKLGDLTPGRLEEPGLNITLGTHYFAGLWQRYQGNMVLALAAYNAGPGRAERWRQQWQHLPLDEFVEWLPFRETRLYVKLVLRNLVNYERLYKAVQSG